MTSDQSSIQQQAALWDAIQNWMSQYPDGKLVLNNFRSSPQQGLDALISWIKNNRTNAPSQVAVYLTGNDINQISNIVISAVKTSATKTDPRSLLKNEILVSVLTAAVGAVALFVSLAYYIDISKSVSFQIIAAVIGFIVALFAVFYQLKNKGE